MANGRLASRNPSGPLFGTERTSVGAVMVRLISAEASESFPLLYGPVWWTRFVSSTSLSASQLG